jgi:hypothetical protein
MMVNTVSNSMRVKAVQRERHGAAEGVGIMPVAYNLPARIAKGP